MLRRRWFHDKTTAVAVGLLSLGVAWKALYDAYEGRGGQTPKWLRPITWW